MIKNFFSKPYAWAGIFSLLLIAAVVFVLLDAFVIQKSMVVVASDSQAVTEEASSTPLDPMITDTSYEDENIKITIETLYLLLSLTAVVINYIYGLFGHGISSPAMTWMFLYPLLGGALCFFLINVLTPCSSLFAGYRVFFNAYNSGIATLTLGSFLKGILDIAGTSSPYIVLFYGAGWLFICIGLILLFKLLAKNWKFFLSEKRTSDRQVRE